MSQVIFAYFGPETVLPLTSTLAAVIGMALMFGRQVKLICKIVLGKLLEAIRRPAVDATPLQRAGKRIDRAMFAVPPQTVVIKDSEAHANPVES